MSYIEYDKSQLINLGYMLDKEFLRSNRAGSYASTTLIGCTTRKYMVVDLTPAGVDGGNHVLLSPSTRRCYSMKAVFNLVSISSRRGLSTKLGHKYLRDLSSDPIPKLIRVGGVVLTKDQLFSQKTSALNTLHPR
jgi:hypothetical protein